MKYKGIFKLASVQLNPSAEDLTIRISDDDDILNVTIPAGAMTEVRAGRLWKLANSLGLKKASLKIGSNGRGKLSVQSEKVSTDLTAFVAHFVHTKITSTTFSAEHSRLWKPAGISLKTKN